MIKKGLISRSILFFYKVSYQILSTVLSIIESAMSLSTAMLKSLKKASILESIDSCI